MAELSFLNWAAGGELKSSLLLSAATFQRSTAEKLSFIFLHVIDLMLTLCAVYAGLTELNPLIRHLLDNPLQLVSLKVIFPILIAWLIPGRLLLPAILFSLLLVCWNVKELLLFTL